MALFLLDTDAVIAYLKGFLPSVRLLQDLDDRGEELCLCLVGMTEVYSGLPPNSRASADLFLDACTFLPASPRSAKRAGAWRCDYARQGIQLSTTDTLIAATAAEHQSTVVTGNIAHFPTVPTLQLPRPR